MKKIGQILLPLLLFFTFLSYSSQPSLAHVSGQPFLKINGKYAPANASYFTTPALGDNIPQDLGGDKFLANETITLEIDTSAISVQKELIPKATFRWSWDEGSTEYQYGLKVTHTYSNIGTHIASLDIQAPGDVAFTPYDTIALDIVPNKDYQLPAATIYINAKDLKSGNPINFSAQFNSNPQVKIENYYFFVEGQKLTNQSSFEHIFNDKDFFQLVFLKYTDSNGLSGYRGAWLEGTEGKIQLSFPPNSHDEVIIGNNSSKTTNGGSKTFNLNPMWYGIGALIIFGVGFGLIMKKKSK